MANIAKYNTRVVQKHDTKANWDKATNFVPLPGEIIIYDDLDRIKIGDGTTTVVNLPFSIPTKAEVGLGNVDNTSDADKPISSATQAALDGKAARIHDHSAENITSGTMSTDRLPVATGSSAGITVVYPAEKCTTFSSDSGTVTPLAVQKGAKRFAITRPSASTNKAIVRYSNTTGDVQNSKIIIEDVTNTRDTSKKANVIAIPAEGNKKMVYGYCTDQVDGTSFVGGVFPADATEYPYNAGLAIGGTSGNLLWKGDRVATATDLAGKASTSVATTSVAGLMSAADKKKLNSAASLYVGSGDMPAGYNIQIDPTAVGLAIAEEVSV